MKRMMLNNMCEWQGWPLLRNIRTLVEAAGGKLRDFAWTAADFGLQPAGRETMLVEGPEQSAALIRDIFDGQTGPPRDIVVANAAAALWTAGRDDALHECARLAAEAIDSGAARELLARLAQRTNAS